MNKKVCMFVWNHFTNDARVLRECTALSDAGYSVDLIAIHDRKNPTLKRVEKRNENFNVIRVKNDFPLFQKAVGVFSKGRRFIVRNKVMTGLLGCAATFGLFFLPKILSLCLVLVVMLIGTLAFTKLPKYTVRFLIFIQMVKWGMKRRYDIYHSNDLNTLPQGWLCAKVLRFNSIPLIYDSHEVQTSRTGYNSKIYGVLEKFYLRFINVMIMENHTRAKFIKRLYGFYPEVVHNYPIPTQPEKHDSINLKDMLHLDDSEPILLYQGGIQTGRGLEQLIRAIPQINKGRVIFIGDGRIKEKLIKMVNDMGLDGRVHFLPKVPVEELLHYTRNAYLGFQILNNVCFNHYSASSNKLFEYMMSGVPVVACSFPEIKRVVDTENIGVCVDSHDPSSIAQGVNYLLENIAMHQKMRENCFQAREKYNWEKEKFNFLNIYKQLI